MKNVSSNRKKYFAQNNKKQKTLIALFFLFLTQRKKKLERIEKLSKEPKRTICFMHVVHFFPALSTVHASASYIAMLKVSNFIL